VAVTDTLPACCSLPPADLEAVADQLAGPGKRNTRHDDPNFKNAEQSRRCVAGWAHTPWLLPACLWACCEGCDGAA
jgi:hypothetical protein